MNTPLLNQKDYKKPLDLQVHITLVLVVPVVLFLQVLVELQQVQHTMLYKFHHNECHLSLELVNIY